MGRKLQELAALATLAGALTTVDASCVRAEFQIQEADIEKGSTEFEYRGAYHWGVPEASDDNPNANDLIQSHEFEVQYGVTNWWRLQFTLGTEQPLHGDFNTSDVEFETEFGLIRREGDGVALSVQGGYERSLSGDDADVVGFGPIVEFASGKLLITLNPLFTYQVGPAQETEDIGFGYGWRAEYDFANHWGVGVEMFGGIEDLSNVGTLNDHDNSLGPTLFWHPGASGDEGDAQEAGNESEAGGSPPMPSIEASFNVGFQFGLTDATSDVALKLQGSLQF
jgi:hypothetical protein